MFHPDLAIFVRITKYVSILNKVEKYVREIVNNKYKYYINVSHFIKEYFPLRGITHHAVHQLVAWKPNSKGTYARST